MRLNLSGGDLERAKKGLKQSTGLINECLNELLVYFFLNCLRFDANIFQYILIINNTYSGKVIIIFAVIQSVYSVVVD